MRVRNEERWIGHSIQSIIEFIPGVEIIIIDNNSNDNSINIAKHFQKDPKLDNSDLLRYTNMKFINIHDYTPGKALNLGVRESSFEDCLVISAHCVIKLINLSSILSDLTNYKSIFGKQIPVWNGKKIKPRYVWSNFVNEKIVNMYSDLENRYFHHNAAAFYKKTFLLDNPFDPNLQSKEDRYWANEIIKKNNKILYNPEFQVFHHYTINGNTWKGI